jgi:hypothetical protein
VEVDVLRCLKDRLAADSSRRRKRISVRRIITILICNNTVIFVKFTGKRRCTFITG